MEANKRTVMKKVVGVIIAWLSMLGLANAQMLNGDFSSGNLSGWSQTAFRDDTPSVFASPLLYGVPPNFLAFQVAEVAGASASSSNAVVTAQSDNFDGNGPFLSTTPIAAPSGTPIAFITNQDAEASIDGNTLVGSSVFQTFFVPNDATTLTVLARQLSNEGLDTASDVGGNTVGADFGGVALHSGDTIFQQYLFDEQSDSVADFHVANFSDDGSTGFGGFVSGTDWQLLTFALTGLRGQNVTLTAFQVNTGDVNFESRLLIANVVMNGAGTSAAPEPGTALYVLMGGCILVGGRLVKRRRSRHAA
jgi:hypothetical protein